MTQSLDAGSGSMHSLIFHVHPVKLASHTGAKAYRYFHSG